MFSNVLFIEDSLTNLLDLSFYHKLPLVYMPYRLIGKKKIVRGSIQVVYIFMSTVPKLLLPPDGGDPVTLPPTHPPLP